jgi:anaerobic selenocysteine-containing dehydrogenase
MSTIHTRTCSICEAACGLLITVENGVATRIVGDPADPLSKGHICPKAYGLKDMQEDKDRLHRPVKRVGDKWEEIGWDQAFGEIAARLTAIQAQHGHNAVAIYRGNPNVHNFGLTMHGGSISRALKTKVNFSASTVDQIPLQLTAMWMYGHNFLIPVIDIDRAHTVLMLGANPLASNGSLWTVPGAKERLEAMMARGGHLTVVDPRRTETAKIASAYIGIQPGRDVFLLIGLLLSLRAQGLVQPGRLAPMMRGWDDAWAAFEGLTLTQMADASGIAEAEINALAHGLGTAPVAAVYGRMGLSTTGFGTLCMWLIQMLNLSLGSVDKEGGVMFNQPAVDSVAISSPGSYARFRSRVSGHPEVLGEFPASAMAEEMLTPGEGQIKALICVAGNPVLSTPNGAQLDKALGALDCVVAIDPHITETTRHAHYILPPCGPLEKAHYPMPFYQLAVHQIAKFSPAILPREEDSLDDWEIVTKLAKAIAALNGVSLRDIVPPDDMLPAMLSASGGKVTWHEVTAAPHGIDLGAMASCLPERLRTADKLINCAPPEVVSDMARLRAQLSMPKHDGLHLIGRRHIRSNNSWLHNSQRLVKGPPRCTFMIHPDDARARNLGEGSMAQVRSRVGAVTLPVEVTDDMMRGVVSIPHGFGHGRNGVGWAIAAAHAGVSCNDLTDETLLDPISGNAAVNGVPVDVSAVELVEVAASA